MKKYLLIIREDLRQARSEEVLNLKTKLHLQWAEELKDREIFLSGFPMTEKITQIVKSNDDIINREVLDLENAIGGMYFIQANTYEEAQTIALDCPTLDVNDVVEVRELY